VKMTAPGGWLIEQVDLEGATTPKNRKTVTQPVGDGPQLLVRRNGKVHSYVRTAAELKPLFDTGTLALQAA
jgi:hypothetical protein